MNTLVYYQFLRQLIITIIIWVELILLTNYEQVLLLNNVG
jgi:hypothetical protein